jgi:hypothetical protein
MQSNINSRMDMHNHQRQYVLVITTANIISSRVSVKI